ncbi:LOW QUALITY PROTEIN: 5-azacytidine-induced protein 2-like [Lampetra planeri]
MEPLAVDDDICILKHETAYTATGESPVSVRAGDESVASHFALVTAYEDIKKRLRDTERENTLLRKRVKQLEDKLFKPEAPPSEGPLYVNKAFSAYRGIYIEKEDLQMELNKLKKEKSESERLLTEQLQAKELELLQLRTEMETSQVMKSLNSPQDFWQVDRVAELKIHKLQGELERVTLENSRQLERSTEEPHGLNGLNMDQTADAKYKAREQSMQQTYEGLCCEITHLHSELKRQTGLIGKLRPLTSETRLAASTVPVQCLDDMEKKHNHPILRAPVPRPPSTPPLPSCSGRPCPPVAGQSGASLLDSLREDCWYNGPWPSHSSEDALAGSDTCSVVLPPPPLNQASLDDSSRSFPSPPKPSDAMFWEGHAALSNSSSSMGNCPPSTEWAKHY